MRAKHELAQQKRELQQIFFSKKTMNFNEDYFQEQQEEPAPERDSEDAKLLNAVVRQYNGGDKEQQKKLIEIELTATARMSIRLEDGQPVQQEEPGQEEVKQPSAWQKFTSGFAKLCGTGQKANPEQEQIGNGGGPASLSQPVREDSEMIRKRTVKKQEFEAQQ